MKSKKLYYAAIIIFLLTATIYATTGNDLSPEEIHVKNIESQFSLVNGEHNTLSKYIKSHLNDPESFEHVNTTYRDGTDYIVVNEQYSYKNEFGGRVQGTIEAKVDLNGTILEIIGDNKSGLILSTP